MLVAWSCFAVYLAAARVVGNFYPLSVFDMYQGHAPEVAARVVVIDAQGRASQLRHFEGFACEPAALELEAAQIEAQCGADHRPLPYVLRDQQHWIADHIDPAGGSTSITIVSRAHVLEERAGAPAVRDCALARCTARRRGAEP